MKKILALDLGDAWVGSALSDELGMIARPYQTVTADQLSSFLEQILKQESVSTVIVGLPTRLGGTHSPQADKIKATTKELDRLFANTEFILWNERLSSKQAEKLKRPRTKQEKQHAHSVAAAFILQSYLDSRAF